MFHFTCFNVEDPNDPTVGLVDGQLSIPGNLLRREVFDPVVAEVCDAVPSLAHLPHLFALRRYCSSSSTKHGRSIKTFMLCCSWEVLPEANI